MARWPRSTMGKVRRPRPPNPPRPATRPAKRTAEAAAEYNQEVPLTQPKYEPYSLMLTEPRGDVFVCRVASLGQLVDSSIDL